MIKSFITGQSLCQPKFVLQRMVGGIEPNPSAFHLDHHQVWKTINNSTELPKPQKEIMKMVGLM